jgi:KDO2-lipid IV(A) lauroyltransferase
VFISHRNLRREFPGRCGNPYSKRDDGHRNQMKKIRHYLEYKILLGIGFLIRGLPRSTMLQLGRLVGDFIYFCVPVRKSIVFNHLEFSFPDKSAAQRKIIARGAYQNFGMNVFEHLCVPMLSNEDFRRIVKLVDEDVLVQALEKGRGVIIAGGHFGNWEYTSSAVAAYGYRLGVVVAEVSNKYIDKRVNEHREASGAEMIPKGASTRAVIRILRENGVMGMLMDQDENEDGIFVDFFGRPCSTAKGPAALALKTGASIIFFAAIRQHDGSIDVAFEPVEIDYEAGMTEENIVDITQRCTSRLEHYTRLYPDQWFWMHRRWKTRPEQEISRA